MAKEIIKVEKAIHPYSYLTNDWGRPQSDFSVSDVANDYYEYQNDGRSIDEIELEYMYQVGGLKDGLELINSSFIGFDEWI